MATIVKGHIASLTRLRNSAGGNPRFKITLVEGLVFATEPDSSFAYGLDDPRYVGRKITSIPAPLVTLTVNGYGNVENITTEESS